MANTFPAMKKKIVHVKQNIISWKRYLLEFTANVQYIAYSSSLSSTIQNRCFTLPIKDSERKSWNSVTQKNFSRKKFGRRKFITLCSALLFNAILTIRPFHVFIRIAISLIFVTDIVFKRFWKKRIVWNRFVQVLCRVSQVSALPISSLKHWSNLGRIWQLCGRDSGLLYSQISA